MIERDGAALSTTLTERYLHAAVRRVPEASRSDVAAELEASIADQIDARVAGGESRAAAERAVLDAMGDPDRLAAEYTDHPTHLIGPQSYFEWRRLLVLLLWIVLPCAGLGAGIVRTITGSDVPDVFAGVLATVLNAGVHLTFWTTLLFVVLERTTSPRNATVVPWSLDRLPDPRARASLADLVASLVVLMLVTGAVAWDRWIGFSTVDGEAVAILHPGLWPWGITTLLVLMVAKGALAVAVFRARRWTMPLAWANAAIAVAVAILVLVLLTRGELVSPEIVDHAFAEAGNPVVHVTGILISASVVGIAGWDTLSGFRKARHEPRGGPTSGARGTRGWA